MDTIDLNAVNEILKNDRIKLMGEIQAEEEKLDIDTEVNPDPLDLADKRIQQEITAGRLRHLDRKLKQVEAALQRVKEGKYGICVKCGNPINSERLQAMPYATLCINCKKRQERRL